MKRAKKRRGIKKGENMRRGKKKNDYQVNLCGVGCYSTNELI